MSQLSVTLFGPPQIKIDGKSIHINRRKALALFTYLAVSQQKLSRDALATMFWPEVDQSRSLASLRNALWSLNQTELADWLVVDQDTVSSISESEMEVDVLCFREKISSVEEHDHPETALCARCHELLVEAVALYKDDFMAGFTLPDAPQFDEWQFFEADDLRQVLSTVLEKLIQFDSAHGEYDRAIHYARRYVALDPLHEPAHRILMRLYAQSGRKNAALRQFEVCWDILKSELDSSPSEETYRLVQQIRRDEVTSESKTAIEFGIPKVKPSETVSNNLPPEPTPFIDREDERNSISIYLGDQTTRLLTITGPGGIGKTRLALAAAAEQLDKANFPDGVYFVSLVSISNADAIVPAIAEAVGFPFQADQRAPEQQLIDYLSLKSMLLILDNLEHLLLPEKSDAGSLVTELLKNAPKVKILTTSREALKLYGEQRFPLQGLSVRDKSSSDPNTEYAAAELFLQTARRLRPDYELTPAEQTVLEEICQLVGGMPLALELASSWIDMLSLHEIAEEMKKSQNFLESNLRDIPDRHRSMQAVFDTTWQSLSDQEKSLYAQLSVFRGGFTQEATVEISGAAVQTLAGLVNKSLLRFDTQFKRYETHELLRQYAAEKLGEAADETLQRHASYYCEYLERCEVDLKGAGQQKAIDNINADLSNFSVAWEWAAEKRRVDLLDKALFALGLYYQLQSRFVDGDTLFQMATDKLAILLPDKETANRTIEYSSEANHQARLLVKLLIWQGYFRLSVSDFELARQSLSHAQTIMNELETEGSEMVATRAFMLLQQSNYSIANNFGGESERQNEESLELFRSIKDDWGTALALDALSQKKMNLGLYDQAIQLLKECLAIRQQLEGQRGIARAYNILGLIVLHIGRIEESEEYLRKSLAIYRSMENRVLISTPLAVLGINLLFGGKFEECIASYQECWDIHKEFGLPQEPFTANVAMTRAKINLGRYQEARQQAETNLAEYKLLNHQWSIAFTQFNLARIDLVEGDLDSALERSLESAGILRDMNERSLLPDVLFGLAFIHLELNDRQQVIDYLLQSLAIVIETKPLNPMRFELPAMALLLADIGEVERAVEFYAAGLKSPYIANSQWFDDIAGKRIEKISASLSDEIVVGAQERGLARDLWTTVNELVSELREFSTK